MPRFPRMIIPEIPHHITQRGNNKNQVFFNPDDFNLYLDLLQHYAGKHNFHVLGYCLMSNHVHLVGIPQSVDSLVNTIRDTHQKYSLFTNRKLNRCGHTWQERAFLCPCDDHHTVASICYSEMNPVRAGMVCGAGDYRWSSARAHLGLQKWPELLDINWWMSSFTYSDWSELMDSYDYNLVSYIKEATMKGLPLGNRDFVSRVENYYGDTFSGPRRGRPVKSTLSSHMTFTSVRESSLVQILQ